ncbi:MAG: amidohydrolase family protein [Acidobacteriota bacterium]|nr:amidohydrolase family protein [Acidobacteriota bacterium]
MALKYLTCLLLFAAPALWAQSTVIHAGHLIDGNSSEIAGKTTITIEDGKITAVESGYKKAPDGATVIDLKDSWVMPGLMDMHTHLSGQANPNSYNEGFRMNPEDYAFRSVRYAERTLMAGFTTVREVGGNMSIALRNAVRKGWIKGPRIFAAGQSIATTGGHADRTNSLNHFLMGDPGPAEGVINGADEARKAVRQRYKNGADHIKITATGGVLSNAKNGRNPQFNQEELDALVQTARDYEMHVAAHAHGAEGMKRALRAGVLTIEHGTFMDDEVIALMKEKGAYLVPTMMAGDWVTKKAQDPDYFPKLVRPKALATGPAMRTNFTRAYKEGVNIAFGTDSGVSAHGENGYEFFLMVDAGMPPMEAIQSATSVSAKLLGIQDSLGTVEAGKIADIVAVKEDPTKNIRIMEDVSFVMKEGVVYKQ